MRPIKFRAWDTENKMMLIGNNGLCMFLTCGVLGWNFANEINVLSGYTKQDKYILMQFTGLHDKNGIEIYDKCVLNKKTTFDNNMSDKRFQLDTQINVGFENGCFVDKNTGVSLYDKMMTITSYPRKTWTEYEIVGTELENPDLL